MAMKGYLTLPKAPGLETHHQMVSYHNQDTGTGWGRATFAEILSMYSKVPSQLSLIDRAFDKIQSRIK